MKPKLISPVSSRTCHLCNSVLATVKGMRRHLREVHPKGNNFECVTCHNMFKSRSTLRMHQKFVHNKHLQGKQFICVFCNKTFMLKHGLFDHIHSHILERVHCCTVCDKFYGDKPNLKRHLRNHNGERPYQCELCPKAFISKSYLNYHVGTHTTGNKPFVCVLCEKSFRVKKLLKVHTARVHAQSVKPFKCESCRKTFMTNQERLRHSRVHTGKTPYPCEICDKRFSRSTTRNLHITVHHTKEKAYKCELCIQSYNTSSSLKAHQQRRHFGGDKTSACIFCGVRVTKTGLYRHLAVHIREPFNCCQTCGTVAPGKSAMKIHKSCHPTGKIFKCHLCDSVFFKRSRLHSHFHREHCVIPTCVFCHHRVTTVGYLYDHIREHLGEKPITCGRCPMTFFSIAGKCQHKKNCV